MYKYARVLDRYLGDFQLPTPLAEEEEEEKALCESSLYEFSKRAWKVSEGTAFIPGWHLDVVTEHLEALYYYDITDLLINMPFRSGKSMTVGVFYPAWVFIQDPSESFLYSSYSQFLSVRDSVKCRRLIESDWYQKYWGTSVKLRPGAKNKLTFETLRGGYRISSSVDGSNTGSGANTIVTDDPNNIREIESEVTRLNTNEWWDNVMSSRYRLLKDRRRLIAQQRSHENDLSGHILAKEDSSWVHLCLPMEFERHRRCSTIVLPSSNGKVWTDPRKREGELMWPAGVDAKGLAKLKKDFNNNSYIIAGQLQQRPSPAEGGILQKSWFKHWKQKDLPNFEYVLQSWDTALTNTKNSAFNACTTWGVFKDDGGILNVMLLSLFQGQIEYPDLRKMAVRLSNNYEDTDMEYPSLGHNRPDQILIEAKVSGYCLHSDLMRANLPVMKFNPNPHGDKEARCKLVSHLMENGLVWVRTLPPKYEYLTKDAQVFLEAAGMFPNGRSMDIIDSMSQAFIRMMQNGWLTNKEDPAPPQEEAWKKNSRPYS